MTAPASDLSQAPTLLPGTAPCSGCGAARHQLVGKVPCSECETVRWTLAVTGSRTLARQPSQVLDAARDGLVELRGRMGGWPALVLHGDAAGVDRLLAARLTAAGWQVQAVPADWSRGRQAGVLRDLALVARADALLAVWDGASRGTRHTLNLAHQRSLPVAGATLRDGACHPLPQPSTRAPVSRRAAAADLQSGAADDDVRAEAGLSLWR